MLISLLNWMYIAATSIVAAIFIIPRFAKVLDREATQFFNFFDYFFGGIIIVTVYAEIFSLLGGVGITANVIMVLLDAIFVYIDRQYYKQLMLHLKKSIKGNRGLIIPFACVILLCLRYTSQSTFHYDTGLYHAQAIHWIEEYGVVKGLGNIHVRLAYNSALFALSALYSFRDITGGQSLHGISGIMMAAACLY